ncbi:MAG: sugar phosphate isomerase/epimerase [Nitrospinae bacterium]|nr:sugar phosphate isomerase/epimerase [Nitrospinota bacterium]
MFNSVSSCWRSGKILNAQFLIQNIKEVGLDSVELEFRIKPHVFEEIKRNVFDWGMKVSSLHAVCPSPEGRGRGAEAFFLNDSNEDNRKRAVEGIVTTMEHAQALNVKVIVVHAGMTDMDYPTDVMRTIYDKGKIKTPETQKIKEKLKNIRYEAGKRCYEQLLKSLIVINHEAMVRGIMVGLENRYHFHEMPGVQEFKDLLNAFHGGNIGYWHDTGHAHAQETLYDIPQKELLENFSDKLIGIHLHDVVKGYKDHQEPGCGEIDFTMVKSFLQQDTIRVVELNQTVSLKKAKQGVSFLKKMGIFTE